MSTESDASRPPALSVGATTFAVFLSGEAGVGLIGVYLFFIFGNGFRYGRKHLAISQLLSVVGFAIVLLVAPWWRDHPAIGPGLMMMLVVIPSYVGVLLRRPMQHRASQSA